MSDSATVTATPMRERTAEVIWLLLRRRRISASHLARQTGMTQPYISRRLTGEIAFNVDDLDAIARALGVEIAALLPRRPGADIGWYPPPATRPAERSTRPVPTSTNRPADTRPAGRGKQPAPPVTIGRTEIIRRFAPGRLT